MGNTYYYSDYYQEWRLTKVELKSLIAPEHFNLASEISKHESDKIALRWENELGETKTITYAELINKANKLANGLTNLGLAKG
ncbi:MAG: hypothetical protein ACJ8MO_12015, partial [Bacillus sp. (in: firmicutes)]